MEYYNFLTTPSGRYCEVKDITNRDYLLLIKFIESENFKGFFDCLNEIVLKSIPDFQDFNIVDKCYVYIAMCLYSIRGTIEVKNDKLGTQIVSLGQVLQNIEKCYHHGGLYEYDIKDGATLKFGIPSGFSIKQNLPQIDWVSGLQYLNDKKLSKEQVNALKPSLRAFDMMVLQKEIRQHFEMMCDIFEGVPMNELTMNICSQSLLSNVVYFFKYPLQGFYANMYACCRHLKISFNDFMERTMVETELFISFAKKQNEEMNKKDTTGIGRMSQLINE